MRGRLIAVSGCDGSGKSTLTRGLVEHLEERGVPALAVSPLKPALGGTAPWAREVPVAAELRELWIAQYFALVLVDNAHRVVLPALAAGTWVVADRWGLDHLANQAALGVAPGNLEPWLRDLPIPDAHLLIDVPAPVALGRVSARSTDPGFGTGEGFLSRAAAAMREAARTRAPGGVTVLDGMLPPGELLDAAAAAIPDPAASAGAAR